MAPKEARNEKHFFHVKFVKNMSVKIFERSWLISEGESQQERGIIGVVCRAR